MANKIPLKATYSGSNTSGLAEFQSGDTIDASFISGGLAPLASPTFTGTPAAPTAAVATNTTQLATTAFVRGEVTALVASAPGTLDTLNELAAALGDDANFSTTVTNSIATKLSLSGGAMTGAITTNSTFDGVDIAVRDAVLTSTTTTANNALPKAGGTMNGHLNIADNVKIQLGNSQDLRIFHDGANSYVTDVGTGGLKLQGSTFLHLTSASGAYYFAADDGDAANLYFNGSNKLQTRNTGINVTGKIICDALQLLDNEKIELGTHGDLLIYHDGSNSYVKDVGVGNMYLMGENLFLDNADGTKRYVSCTAGTGEVSLSYNNAEKIKTTANGISVTGGITLTGGLTGDTLGWDTSDYIQHSNNANIGFVVNGNEEMRIEADGDLHADGDVIAYSTTISDERLKENIQPIEDALSKVNQLTGYTFTYTVDGKESAGLIAQEVEKVLPSAVS